MKPTSNGWKPVCRRYKFLSRIILLLLLKLFLFQVCTYESMQAGLHHLKRMGVHKLTQPSGLAAAMNQLPDEAITIAAASHIERELQITPWNLSSNFVAATMQVTRLGYPQSIKYPALCGHEV